MNTLLQQAKKQQSALITLRRQLHEHAETGFALSKTLQIVTKQLEKLGITLAPCGKAGLTAVIGDKKSKRTVLLRADMDALPIQEDTNEPYACGEGNMHACGHDVHTAMLLGAAQLLKAREKSLRGCVKLLFQPAEEILQGAENVIKHGALENPKPNVAFALHVATGGELPTGTAVLSTNETAAPAADYLQIRFTGKSCHGATPHLGRDALLAAAQTVVALQTLPAREQAIDEPFVLTIGKCTAGEAGNAIAQTATLMGTLRAYTERTRERVKTRIKEIAAAQAKSIGVRANVRFVGGCPTLKNDGKLVAHAAKCVQTLFGAKSLLTTNGRGGGSEDFAYISHALPSVLVVLSAGEKRKGYTYPLHHPKTRFDEDVLWRGSALFCHLAEEWLINADK